MKKRFISAAIALALCLCLLFSSNVLALDSYTSYGIDDLSFNDDGSFKIMQIADLQNASTLNPAVKEFLRAALESEKPDLVVLSGDNIAGEYLTGSLRYGQLLQAKSAINQFMSIFQEAGVPVALVFGNHDSYGLVSNEEQMEIYQQYGVCIAIDQPDDVAEDLNGCGNYRVPIYGADGSEKFQLFFLDSGSDSPTKEGYACVRQNQLDWLESANDTAIPAMVFQHIIVPEIEDYLVPSSADGSIKLNGKRYVLPSNATGVMNERPSPPTEDYEGEWAVLQAQGNIQALVVGHDHTNNFVVPTGGVDIMNSTAIGMGAAAYNGNMDRGARIITLKEDGSKYEERTLLFRELMTDPVSKLILEWNCAGERGVTDEIATFFVNSFGTLLYPFVKFWNCLTGLFS
ncbi:MAG: metallophosphoesterase [Clostridium sp.]|jgi:hypothetical protein|nr:metallophosphoesterase [Clostridium sp.]